MWHSASSVNLLMYMSYSWSLLRRTLVLCKRILYWPRSSVSGRTTVLYVLFRVAWGIMSPCSLIFLIAFLDSPQNFTFQGIVFCKVFKCVDLVTVTSYMFVDTGYMFQFLYIELCNIEYCNSSDFDVQLKSCKKESLVTCKDHKTPQNVQHWGTTYYVLSGMWSLFLISPSGLNMLSVVRLWRLEPVAIIDQPSWHCKAQEKIIIWTDWYQSCGDRLHQNWP